MNSKDFSKLSKYTNREEGSEINLERLVPELIDFLECFGEPALMGREFSSVIGQGGGEKRFFRLLEAAGHTNDPANFFKELIQKISKSGRKKITVNKLVMPHILLVHVLEIVIPGNGLVSVNDIDQLEKVANSRIPENTKEELKKVIEAYPVKLSGHVIRQAAVSQHVANQYLPFVEELDNTGHKDTWVGPFQNGIIEQMYRNRVILLVSMSCPAYCRFCFRKHKDSRKAPNPSTGDVKKAVEHVKRLPSVKEVLVTGGDPFFNKENLECVINDMTKVDQVKTLRLATRSIAYYPHLFLADDSAYLEYLKEINRVFQEKSKWVEVATHFIHPDEISPESLEIITNLVKNGIKVYIQTPILKHCNEKGEDLARLFSLLRGAGAEIHYIFTPCSPIHGNSVYGTTISNGFTIAEYLRAHLSDRAIPKISTSTPIGKMEWHSSGWAVEHDSKDKNFIWIRTPYTPDYFNSFVPKENNPEYSGLTRINDEGTFDVRFMADIGDDSLFQGKRPRRVLPLKKTTFQDLNELRKIMLNHQSVKHSIVETGVTTLFRLHETRVELTKNAGDDAFHYIQQDDRITDVVLALQKPNTEFFSDISSIIRKLSCIWHVNSVRLRLLEFNSSPQLFTPAFVDRLGSLNKLTVVNPQRIEIETWFLTADEIRSEHADLARSLNNMGVTVYNNTPLLGEVNDSPDEIQRLSSLLREAGIEFHHLYIAGLTIQNRWNKDHPIEIADIIDIASRIRRDGSGREISRYIIQTTLGETDYGLTSSFIHTNGQLFAKLHCYDMNYYKRMDPDFSWPENVTEDNSGKPIVPVIGLLNSDDFLI